MSTELSTAPSHGDNHPAALALHHMSNAAQIIVLQKHCVELDEPSEGRDTQIVVGLSRATDLLAQAQKDLLAMNELLQRQERTIEEQNVSLIRERQYSTRVESKNSELAESVITLTRQLDDAHAVLVAQKETTPTRITGPRHIAAGA